MRVLLTGAAGFLGSHALRHILVNTDWHVVCPVSFNHKGLPERLVLVVEEHQWDRVTIVRCDIAAPIAPTTAALFGDINYIINYAAESHVDRSISNPVPFVRNNVDLMLHMLEYARAVKPKAFLHISTDEVYGPAAGNERAEWDPIIPSSPYSASKAAQEALAISYWRTYGVPVVIVNCMNLVGEMQDPEKFVPSTIAKILHGEPVQIHAPNGQVGSRFYLHARNLADAVLFLLRRGNFAAFAAGATRPDRWHVTGEREVANLDMAQAIADLLGKPFDYELVDPHHRPGHDQRYVLDGAKLAAAGWTVPVELDDMLKKLVEWTVEHPLWLQRRT